jgi:hypothetical protein
MPITPADPDQGLNLSNKNNPSEGINLSDKEICRPRGRPKGSKNKRPARNHSSFTIRDVPDSISGFLTTKAVLERITVGEALTLIVKEYRAAHAVAITPEKQPEYDEIARLFGHKI